MEESCIPLTSVMKFEHTIKNTFREKSKNLKSKYYWFAPKLVRVRGLWGEFSSQPEYQIFTKMTPKECLNMKISQIFRQKSGSKRKINTQQEYL